MQRVTLVQYTAKPDRAVENEALSRAVFAELRASMPTGMTYMFFREGRDFVHLFVNTRSDDATVLTELPSFKAFTEGSMDRYETPPAVTRLSLEMVESYGLAPE